jgi:hypothetical protein
MRNLSKKVKKLHKLTPQEIVMLKSFNKVEKESEILAFLKKAAVPIALVGGFFIAIFPQQTDLLVKHMPSWTNMPEQMVMGVDYIWNIIGEPVGKANILYHLPNIVLYSFGVLGVKKLFDAIDRKTWIDRVNAAKKSLEEHLALGTTPLSLKKGHSALFVGSGDFIGMQYTLNNIKSTVVIAENKPDYTNLWNFYRPEAGYESLSTLLERACGKEVGEYVFFPVKDAEIFLPAENAYDLSPHKLDILCQDIRLIEKKNKWKAKRIIIVGDRFHQSFVQSEDELKKIKGSEDTITLESIAAKYPNTTILDPTDIVISHVLKVANGRKIVFRATKEGIVEYKKRFYARLKLLGYKEGKRKGILTIGYDLFEDLTEQQTLSRFVNDYYPVVLSKSVSDALLRNGYNKNEFIYVPDLVLEELSKKTSEQ